VPAGTRSLKTPSTSVSADFLKGCPFWVSTLMVASISASPVRASVTRPVTPTNFFIG
jgi:hypothetical protein